MRFEKVSEKLLLFCMGFKTVEVVTGDGMRGGAEAAYALMRM